LPAAEAALNDAFAALDLARARQARARWTALAESANLPIGDPARERAEPALFWLDDQDKRESERREYVAAEARLIDALDDSEASRDQLEGLWHTLVRLNQEVPEHLARRYQSRIAAQELSARGRVRMRIGVGVAIMLILGVSAVLTHRAME